MRVEETIRPDGLRIVTGYIPESKRINIRLLCSRGSDLDPVGKKGMAHLFEHLIFTGTGRRSRQDIELFLKQRASAYGATTEYAFIQYHIAGLARRFNDLLDFMIDAYFCSRFDEQDIRHEQEEIVKELKSHRSNYFFHAYTLVCPLLWRNHPRMRDDKERQLIEVVNVTSSDIIETHRQWHITSRTTVLTVGGVPHDEVCRLLIQLVPLGKEHEHEPIHVYDDEYDLSLQDEPSVVFPWPTLSLAWVGSIYKYPRVSRSADSMALKRYLEEMLVDGMGSRLWRLARGAMPLAYKLGGAISGGYTYGNILQGVVEAETHDIATVRDVLKECFLEPFTDKDQLLYEGVRDHISDQYSVDFESRLDRWMELLQDSVEEGDLTLVEGYFDRMVEMTASITLEELEEVRAQVFTPERMVSVVIEPKA
jgi:predicted Zn-dependent peptidase